ncbi:Zn(II)2Cys6 transcription factor [Aspergillus saccharolyticus JOP 1030-1]|uniref:Zn(2)-C6 fungal-type domain-containing protein n=1 Tax=Aspergillus saccharolyticus JOP 1030-1 TaxID=1450539 RepID=A0A318ZQT7_9EURO|nr:hypothetical protein BP01DRAFT_338868 [Aspergillus saccharolyticus JOP 1030-1]PYH46320.1 hypothetical protein BP01DRAFT_338868 [Aspergillus saccharolyticus JOP 1030-1]
MTSTTNSINGEAAVNPVSVVGDKESPQEDTYPAPYGRSCFNCSQAKCKCLYLKAGGRCQRCQRLDKECRQSAASRRSTTRKAGISSSSAKISRLEDRLEDLVSLLRAGVQPNNITTTTMLGLLGQLSDNQASSNSNAASPPSMLDVPSNGSSGPSPVYVSRNSGATSTPDTSISDSGASLSSGAASLNATEPSGLQAEEYLTFFQTQMLPYFPCMHIPPGTTSQKLRRDRPFSWLCIMAVVSRSSAQTRPLFDRIKHIVSQKLVHEYSCRDLDILQGLLIYLGWSNQQVYNRANVHVFTQLANSIVYEMGLFNPEAKGKHTLLCVHTEAHEDRAAPPSQVMEQRRAVLGCFLLTSIIATFLQQSDSLRWTSYMDECLRLLEEQQESINDEMLVQQVRLQLVNDKLNLGGFFGGSKGSMRPSPAVYIRPMQAQLQTQLQGIMSRVRPNSQGYIEILLLHHYNTSLSLYESALTKGTIASITNVSYEHLDYLYGCLEATKSWFDVFLSIPAAEYIGFPFAIFSQMVQNLVTLYQLSTLDSSVWDTTNVRQTADIIQIMNMVISNMGQVASLNGFEGDPGGDVFSNIAKMYQGVRVGWETKLIPNPLGPHAATSIPSLSANTLSAPPDALSALDTFPLLEDNDWLADMLSTMDKNNKGLTPTISGVPDVP